MNLNMIYISSLDRYKDIHIERQINIKDLEL